MYGRRLYTSVCKNCGDEKKETDALGHTWGKGKVTRKSTYKVTSIGVKAFNCSKKLTKVTIGANIKKVSNNAFFKCRSLKMVNIKSVLLTKKTANKKAFKGTNKKMVIKVSKKMKKAYVKMFKGLKVK